MTVAELIAELQKMPQDAEVFLGVCDEFGKPIYCTNEPPTHWDERDGELPPPEMCVLIDAL